MRRQMHIRSTPTVLQSTFSPILPLRLKANHCQEQSANFRDRSQDQQLGLLDIATRQIALGYDAAEVAFLMDLDLWELAQYIACFAIGIQEATSATSEATFTFGSPSSGEEVGESNDSVTEEARVETSDEWEETYEEEERLIDHQPKVTVESIWDEIQHIIGEEDHLEHLSGKPGEQVVDYDVLPYILKMDNQKDEHCTCFRSTTDLQDAQRLDGPIAGATCSRKDIGATRALPSTQLATSSKIRMRVSMLLAIFIGRFLGILLSELHRLLFDNTNSSSKILLLLGIWSGTIPLIAIGKFMGCN
ncbi:hypothetical protein H2200_009688 [Cladophialophora chaetospira]|uniref:Uncharacterized protein n=1 Tax=Cladophialophora chaetospira TaxID=386627 RepID=A0AA39CF31_9EURO|nr:hypothetical protein H2200_009688 [Cladophialophora chaetospira]